MLSFFYYTSKIKLLTPLNFSHDYLSSALSLLLTEAHIISHLVYGNGLLTNLPPFSFFFHTYVLLSATWMTQLNHHTLVKVSSQPPTAYRIKSNFLAQHRRLL